MDLLRNLGSAAVSSLVQKSGLNLPFSLGEKVTYFEGRTIWSLYDGTKRDDGSPVSVFVFDANQPPRRNLLPLAKNALRKLRTVRHPDVLRFIDAVDSESLIYIMTERVQPLGKAMQSLSMKSAKDKEDWLVWGLHRISTALAFMNDPCSSTHGNLRVDSIFLSPSGEWKLGGFELLSNAKDDAAVLYTLGGILPEANKYASPEVKKTGWSSLKEHHPSVADAYSLGLLVHSIFNPELPPPATAEPPHPPPSPSFRGAIPTYLFNPYKRLLNPNPKARMSPATLLEMGMVQTGDGHGFFANNKYVRICTGLDQFSLNGEAEKAALLKTVKDSANVLPPEFAAHRVLPSLVSALEFGGATASTILPIVLQLGVHAPPADYPTIVLAPITKLFASPDRGTRMALLEHLDEYAEKLDKKTVADKIWPSLQTGFNDTVPVIREATVKSIGILHSKFNDRILNNDLLRFLAKMQLDPESSIRTNTCILIGRLGPSLGYNTKRKVLVPAFARALKDTFVHARVAGLMAFMATSDCFDAEDSATKVIPCISSALIDKEKLVRDQAFKAIELFVKKLESYAESMPETVLAADGQPNSPLPVVNSQSALVNSAAGAAGALAGWAMSSLSKKLVPGDLSTTMSSTANLERSSSAPPPLNGTPIVSSSPGPSSHNSPPKTAVPSFGRSKTMQLGGTTKQSSASKSAALMAELTGEAESDATNTWGNGDLMDINADEDDWSEFAVAPSAPSTSSRKTTALAGLGFGEVASFTAPTLSVDGSDDWGTMDDGPSSTAGDTWGGDLHAPQPIRAHGISPNSTLSPKTTTPRVSSPLSTQSSTSSVASRTPRIQSPSTTTARATTPTPPGSTPMSKEDKAAEMARRKEERKQRIAALKAAKIHGAAKT